MPRYPIVWKPQDGPQKAAFHCPADEIFYGGTRGGGKTDAAIGRQIKKSYKYGSHHNGLMIRRKYKDFSKIRRRWDELIRAGLPARRSGGDNQINYIRFANGAQVTLQAILFPEQADDLQGDDFQEVSIDEGPTIPFIATLIDKLKGVCRSAHGVPCSMFITGNPGGVGASQIAQMYIPEKDGGGSPVSESKVNYVEQKMRDGSIVTFSRVFIYGDLYNNKILMDKDPHYEARLRSIHNKELVDAWLNGKWTAVIGQAFRFTDRHIIKPIWPIPEYAPIYLTYDWGFGAPFSIGWWWVDSDDRIYRFAEWYGWNGVTPNVGLRITDNEVAAGIVKREKKMNIWHRPIHRLSGPDCFSKKADYKGGGQGDSTADEFIKYAQELRMNGKPEDQNATLNLWPGDPDRPRKIRQFRNRLRIPDNPKELPMLVVYDTCKDFQRIIPRLCVDELTGEYLEERQEDHPFDESCHICMARPRGISEDDINLTKEELKHKEAMAKLDSVSRDAAREFEDIVKRIRENESY